MARLSAEERTALCDSVRRLLAGHSGEADVRATMETPSGYDPALWRRLAELGVLGLITPPEHGGAGLGPVELEAVMEEAGAVLLCAPLLASGVTAATLITALGDPEASGRLLPEIADGRSICTVALTGDAGTWTEAGVAVTATPAGEGWRLDGVANYVLHAQNADVLLVVARMGDGFGVFRVDPKVDGVAIEPLPTFDRTLRLARIVFTGASGARFRANGPEWAAVQRAIDLSMVALAGEQAGAARRCLEFTVEYAKTRVQFGRAIGSFQAVKHMAADLLLETESAISAARNAAKRLADDAPDADAAVSLAAFACADAFVTTAAISIQMHGGIAFTWSHQGHLYLRRARAGAQLFGASAYHRERYLRQLGG